MQPRSQRFFSLYEALGMWLRKKKRWDRGWSHAILTGKKTHQIITRFSLTRRIVDYAQQKFLFHETKWRLWQETSRGCDIYLYTCLLSLYVVRNNNEKTSIYMWNQHFKELSRKTSVRN